MATVTDEFGIIKVLKNTFGANLYQEHVEFAKDAILARKLLPASWGNAGVLKYLRGNYENSKTYKTSQNGKYKVCTFMKASKMKECLDEMFGDYWGSCFKAKNEEEVYPTNWGGDMYTTARYYDKSEFDRGVAFLDSVKASYPSCSAMMNASVPSDLLDKSKWNNFLTDTNLDWKAISKKSDLTEEFCDFFAGKLKWNEVSKLIVNFSDDFWINHKNDVKWDVVSRVYEKSEDASLHSKTKGIAPRPFRVWKEIHKLWKIRACNIPKRFFIANDEFDEAVSLVEDCDKGVFATYLLCYNSGYSKETFDKVMQIAMSSNYTVYTNGMLPEYYKFIRSNMDYITYIVKKRYYNNSYSTKENIVNELKRIGALHMNAECDALVDNFRAVPKNSTIFIVLK